LVYHDIGSGWQLGVSPPAACSAMTEVYYF
jgi:hypothetical protein